ncbi:MAG: nuclear transport factor 2 family protein [Candidatus Acidiferrum sp.]
MKNKDMLAMVFALYALVMANAGAGASLPYSANPADQMFLQAVGNKDKAAAVPLLDTDFAWIDSHGKRLNRAEFLEQFPSVANGDVAAEEQVYGNTAVLKSDRGQVHVKRVWVRHGAQWTLLLYQEVTQVEKNETADGVESPECINPCKSIPFDAQTANEKAAVASWQGVMKAMAENDADLYAPLIAEEFTATDTYHDRVYTKADRLEQIAKRKKSGARSVPPELVSAQMFDFGETVVMIAREQRRQGKPYFNSRMWVKRDGRWQMVFSFNTRIE